MTITLVTISPSTFAEAASSAFSGALILPVTSPPINTDAACTSPITTLPAPKIRFPVTVTFPPILPSILAEPSSVKSPLNSAPAPISVFIFVSVLFLPNMFFQTFPRSTIDFQHIHRIDITSVLLHLVSQIRIILTDNK